MKGVCDEYLKGVCEEYLKGACEEYLKGAHMPVTGGKLKTIGSLLKYMLML